MNSFRLFLPFHRIRHHAVLIEVMGFLRPLALSDPLSVSVIKVLLCDCLYSVSAFCSVCSCYFGCLFHFRFCHIPRQCLRLWHRDHCLTQPVLRVILVHRRGLTLAVRFLHLIPVHVILVGNCPFLLPVAPRHCRKELVKSVVGVGCLCVSLRLLDAVSCFIVFISDSLFFIPVLMVGHFRLRELPQRVVGVCFCDIDLIMLCLRCIIDFCLFRELAVLVILVCVGFQDFRTFLINHGGYTVKLIITVGLGDTRTFSRARRCLCTCGFVFCTCGLSRHCCS